MLRGITINETTNAPRIPAVQSLAVIGLVATSSFSGNGAAQIAGDAALDDAFPLNTPVLVSDITNALLLAGDQGTLRPALTHIADQSSPVLIVVRVDAGENTAEEAANVIGGITVDGHTGISALLLAETQTGLRPRIIGAPGYNLESINTALLTAADQLRAFAYIAPEGETQADVITERGNYGAKRAKMIWPDFGTGGDDDFDGAAIAVALGHRARIDEEQGWHVSLSNSTVNGVTGIQTQSFFDPTDQTSPAGVLNAANITTLVRRDGFRFWGNDTLSDEPEFQFETAVRSNDAMRDIIEDLVFPFIDQPVTVPQIKDIIMSANAAVSRLVAQGRIIGGEFSFDTLGNTASTLALGDVKFIHRFTPVAPLNQAIVDLVVTDEYYAGFGDQLA